MVQLTQCACKALGARYFLPYGGLPKNGRRPTIEPFPYVPIRDLKLKDKVSGKYDKEINMTCLQEMALLLACFQKHDFNEAMCGVEIKSLSECHKKSMEEQKARKKRDLEGAMSYGAKHLTHKQTNALLKKYPQKIDGIRRN